MGGALTYDWKVWDVCIFPLGLCGLQNGTHNTMQCSCLFSSWNTEADWRNICVWMQLFPIWILIKSCYMVLQLSPGTEDCKRAASVPPKCPLALDKFMPYYWSCCSWGSRNPRLVLLHLLTSSSVQNCLFSKCLLVLVDIVLYVVLIFVQSTSKGGQYIISEDTGEYIG